MKSNQKAKEELIEEFIEKMTNLGFVSNLTGAIFFDPIHLGEKSTEVFERQFIEECAIKTGKNPITREPFTLNDVQEIPSLVEMRDQIENEIKNFLEENKKHAEIEEIEKAIKAERYVNKTITIPQTQPQPTQPTHPTADDLLAMGINPNQATATALGQSFFQQSPAQQSWNANEPQATLPNGQIVVGGNRYNDYIRIYHPNTSALVKRFGQNGEGVNTIAVLADGNIAVGGNMYNAHIRIYNPETGALVKRFGQDGDGVNAIAVLADGNIAVGGGVYDAHIRIYNPTTGALVKRFGQNGEGVNAIAVLADGNIAVGGGTSNAHIRIYNPTTGALVKRFGQDRGGVNAIAVLADGNIAVGGGAYNAHIRIYNPINGTLVNSYLQNGGINSVVMLLQALQGINQPAPPSISGL